MYFGDLPDEGKLETCRVRIDNSLSSPEILERVAEYGYTKEKLLQGQALVEQATALYQQQDGEYDDQKAATRAYKARFQEAHNQYMRFVKVARVAFEEDIDTYQRLGLFGERSLLFDVWLPQVRKFYDQALQDPDILAALGQWNITQKRLEDGVALVEEAVRAHDAQIKETGEAQQSTQEKDAAIDAAYRWTNTYQKIAAIALEETPQLLEKIGILVRS